MPTERTPKPVRPYQIVALVLLAAFAAQCCYFVFAVSLTQLEADQIRRGVELLHHAPWMPEAASSPLISLLSVAGIAFHLRHGAVPDQFWLDAHRWFIRAPFLLAGLCLALSLWYIARRLFGNWAGNAALALYAFSPGMVAGSSMAGPQIFAAWGAFGLIFTALATAHTLYAPRPVILWNWKRIILLGVAITFAVGAGWPLVWLLLPAAAFMLWAVPHRPGGALLILAASTVVAGLLLLACYQGRIGMLASGASHAGMAGLAPQILPARLLLRVLLRFFLDAVPATLFLSACALATWMAWRHTRFFSTTVPLIVVVFLLIVGIAWPDAGANAALFATLPFLMLFVSGVFADLCESRWQAPALAFLFAMIAAQAAYSIAGLIRMYSRAM